MTPGELEGARFGPVAHVVDRERIASFVAASGDDSERWFDTAPPGYAAALLFAVAGPFLGDVRVQEHTRTLIHVDQQFRYEAPLRAGRYTVSGRVERVRERSGSWFVTFVAQAEHEAGAVMASTSTFLMSDRPAAAEDRERAEPQPRQRASSTAPGPPRIPTGVGPLDPLPKSASRYDLVRYAAASGDFNPLHWDHEAARNAGLPGIIVHGLLMNAWLAQSAAAVTAGDGLIVAIKARFRNALAPAAAAAVLGEVVGLDPPEADLKLRLTSAGVDMVTATATVRIGEE